MPHIEYSLVLKPVDRVYSHGVDTTWSDEDGDDPSDWIFLMAADCASLDLLDPDRVAPRLDEHGDYYPHYGAFTENGLEIYLRHWVKDCPDRIKHLVEGLLEKRRLGELDFCEIELCRSEVIRSYRSLGRLEGGEWKVTGVEEVEVR